MHGDEIAFGYGFWLLYVERKTGVTFDDVAGIHKVRAELMEVVGFFKHPDRYRRLGGKIPAPEHDRQQLRGSVRRARRQRHVHRGQGARGSPATTIRAGTGIPRTPWPKQFPRDAWR